METIALISGGKDSFFSLIHCQNNGYNIVALANLHPQQDENEDINSFMYQTVGFSVLPHYSTILDIPLYRRSITGKSLNQNLTYQLEENDETEDLFVLINSILEKHPNVKAVSSGAILSTYQRTRVESICERLGLISLGWLWQRSQSCLLREMGDVGLDARIVKVASLGLDETFLGQNVTSSKIQDKLHRLKDKWGANVAGEGGEFETIVVACGDWNKRMEIEESHIMDEGAGVYLVKIGKTTLVDVVPQSIVPTKPQILSKGFRALSQSIRAASYTQTTSVVDLSAKLPKRQDSLFNLQGGLAIFTTLSHLLSTLPSDVYITNTVVLLRSMSLFAEMNTYYKRIITGPNPPSRVCIAVGDYLPDDTDIQMSISTSSLPRKALHVQSRSYWAPANVGPYSQAINTGGLVVVAGMIGLVPETMTIWKGEETDECALALQSMIRVGREMGVNEKCGWVGGVALVVCEDDVSRTDGMWGEYFTSDHQVDDEFEVTGRDVDLPDAIPPLIVVQVAGLPVGANVEFACLGVDESLLDLVEHSLTNSSPEKVLHQVDAGSHRLIWALLKDGTDIVPEIMHLLKSSNTIISFVVYTTAELFGHAGIGRLPPDAMVTIVPVMNVWHQASSWSCAFAIRYEILAAP